MHRPCLSNWLCTAPLLLSYIEVGALFHRIGTALKPEQCQVAGGIH